MGKKMRGMTEVVSNRNYNLATTKGHCLYFKKGVPRQCPNVILEDAIAVGIVPTDDADLPGNDQDGVLPVEATGSARIQQIRDIIEALMRRNQRGDFSASGVPAKKVVEGALGYRIDETELNKVWGTMRMENADDRILDQDNMLGLDAPEKPEDAEELKVALSDAIVSVMDTGDADDFTAAGVPQIRSMVNRLGWNVSEDERDSAWAAYCEEIPAKAVTSKPKPKVKVTK
jgi:hypothetical protein